MSDFYKADLGDGTAQSERFPEALRPGYFAPDEMGVEQLLVLARRMAANLVYFDSNNNEAGTWDDLFATDPAFILADIASTDTAKIEARYRACVAQRSVAARVDLIEQVTTTIDSWSRALRASDQPQVAPVNKKINRAIRESLAARVVGIRGMLDAGGERDSARFTDLGSVWRIADANTRDEDRSYANLTYEEKLQYLDTTFHRCLGTMAYLKEVASPQLEPASGNRNQNPSMSLFIAFLKLYSHAQETINKFPARRLDFYYQRLLQSEARARKPDSVNLALTLAPGQPAAVIPKGTQFLAGKDAADLDIIFASNEKLLLTDAAVQSIRTFNLESDPLISPQRELGCVTRIRAQAYDAAFADDGVPLFGAPASATAEDARIGLAIASPLLLLREGQRNITLDLVCEVNAELPADGEQAAALLDRLSAEQVDGGQAKDSPELQAGSRPAAMADQRRRFCHLLGQVFARESMSSSPWLSPAARKLIREAAARVFESDPGNDHTHDDHDRAEPRPIDVIDELFEHDRTALFYKLLRDSLDVQLTTEQGWLARNNYTISALPDLGGKAVGGLRLELSLSADAPPVTPFDPEVHGSDLATDQPVVRLGLNANSMFFAYSLFAALDIRAVDIGVRVRGARALAVYSDIGQLDSSNSFVPFGALPGRDSYMAIGCFEAARKPLSQANLNIEWGGLPRDFGGFQEHYRGYSTDYNNDSFKVQASVLASGAWSAANADPQRMFTVVEQTGQVGQHCRLDLLQGRRFQVLKADVAESDYRLDNGSRCGFFRVDLSPCDDPFGHAQYPNLLTATLTANIKRRKPLPMPRPPYTPTINKMSLDYAAESSIRFRTETAPQAASIDNRLFQEHPFGGREMEQFGRERPVPFVPRFHMDGYLLIGLTGSSPLGTISLLFDLRGGEFRSIEQTVRHAWFYLVGDEFRQIPQEAILHDTTARFTRSGIVTIDMPADIEMGNTVLPGGDFWIALGAIGDLHRCPRLHAIKTGAVSATRQVTDNDTRFTRLPGGTISEAISAPAGIGTIEQPGDSFGGCPAEDKLRFITRTAERLHHKDRACQPWDYERLTLERFPDLYKVKCFANMSIDHPEPVPGEVLVVVVPRPVQADIGYSQRLLVNADRLEQIQEYLASKSSRFATVSVRNAVYELVQVRCSVKLAEASYHGRYVRDVNRVISEFISPWRPGGYGASFGWRIRRKDIEACIGTLDYVQFVTDFSMLHIAQESERTYCLQDTAPAKEDDKSAAHAHGGADVVRPRFPWSLAVPSRRHFIQIIPEIAEIDAQPTGVGELEVGSTLILGSGNRHG